MTIKFLVAALAATVLLSGCGASSSQGCISVDRTFVTIPVAGDGYDICGDEARDFCELNEGALYFPNTPDEDACIKAGWTTR